MVEKFLKSLTYLSYRRRIKKFLEIEELIKQKRDIFDNLAYSVEGKFHFNDVKTLNDLTGYSARYGYSPGRGAFAMIGLPTNYTDWKFFKEICAYGEIPQNKNIEFYDFPHDVASHIANYSIYGLYGIEKISDLVKFEKIATDFDSRHKDTLSHDYRVISMKCRLSGTYTFDEAEFLNRRQSCWSINRQISYAVLETGEFIAILGFSNRNKDEVAGFRDVWELNKPKPDIQSIAFLNDEDALRIKDFSVYLYDYKFLQAPSEQPAIDKIDRTFTEKFDFYNTPNGKDLRLQGFDST